MPDQNETIIDLKAPPSAPLVYVFLGPRDLIDIRSYISLENACKVANAAGISTLITPLLGGAPGFYNVSSAMNLFLKTAASYFFTAADDMLYPSHIIAKMVEDDKDIVNSIYRKRIINIVTPANYAADVDEFRNKLEAKGLYQTDWASGHTLMIKRKVIEKMVADYPELQYKETESSETMSSALFLPMIVDKKILLDDWAFSYRARMSGFTIWEDFSLNCSHHAGDFIKFPAT